MFPYLEVLVLGPVIVGLALALLPVSVFRSNGVRWIGLGVSVVLFCLAGIMALRFHANSSGYQFVSHHQWIPTLGISWSLGVDGISLVLILLSVILFPIALHASGRQPDEKSFVAWMLVLEGACIGSFAATDLFDFFVLFELTLIPTYFLISNWGLAKGSRAAVKFFVYTFAGSALLLVGILSLVSIHQRDTGHLTFMITELRHTVMSSPTARLLFLAFSAAFVVKAPVFPFHTWSPDAYAEAPPSGAVILAGVMAKLGTYGIIRFDFELFPSASRSLAWLMLTLAVIGIVYGAVVAAGERNLSRVVAYSSLSHMGFIVLGLFAFTSQGLSGSVLQMFNHGIYTAALFIMIGMIYKRRKTLDTNELGGLQTLAPKLAAVFTVIMLASIGLPGLNGFVGEFLILIGGFLGHRWWAVVGTSGVVLSAIYLLWAYQKVFHRAPTHSQPFKDLGARELMTLAPLVLIVVALGVFPSLLLSRINPSVNHVLATHAVVSGTQSLSMAKVGK